jgi:hypothetical protein
VINVILFYLWSIPWGDILPPGDMRSLSLATGLHVIDSKVQRNVNAIVGEFSILPRGSVKSND